MRFLLVVLMFFVLGALLIISNENLALGDKRNMGKFSNLYGVWLDKVYFNLRGITGNVLERNWFPE